MKKNNNPIFKIKSIFILIVFITLVGACKTSKVTKEFKVKGIDKTFVEYQYIFSTATTKKMLGKYNMAIELYKDCIKRNNKSAVSMYEIAEIYVILKEYEKAQFYAQRAVETNNNNFWYKFLLADIYVTVSNNEKAIELYNAIIKQFPNKIFIYHNLANLYISNKKYNSAIGVYNQIEKKIGITERVSLKKNELYYKVKKYDAGIEELNKLINLFPNESRYYGMLAEFYTTIKQEDKAIKIYEKLLEIDPSNKLVHISLSNFYRMTGDYEKSLKETKIVFKSPDIKTDIKIRLLFSYINIRKNKYNEEKIYDLWNLLIENNPNNAEIHSLFADYLMTSGEYKGAKEHLLIAKNLKQNNSQVWEKLLMVETQNNEFDSVYMHSNEAIDIYPNLPIFYLYNGIALIRKYKYDESVEILESGLDLVIDDNEMTIQFYTYLGEAYYRVKMYNKSDKAFETVLKSQPKNKTVLNNYSYYLALRNEKLDIAKTNIETCITIEPNNATFLDTYAWVLFKLGKYKDALRIIRASIRIGGYKKFSILEHYGDILLKNGKTQDAIEQWKKALKLSPDNKELELKINSN